MFTSLCKNKNQLNFVIYKFLLAFSCGARLFNHLVWVDKRDVVNEGKARDKPPGNYAKKRTGVVQLEPNNNENEPDIAHSLSDDTEFGFKPTNA